MSELKQIIASNIIQLRKQNKLTQAELAQKLNYSDKAISKWERGESIPDVEILKQISDMFGVTVDYLLTENAEQHKGKFTISKENKSNQLTIALLGVCMVWLVATIIYVYAQINLQTNLWILFVWSVPVSSIVLLIFNNMWSKNKKFEFCLNTIFSWSFLASFYLQFLSYNIWLIFLVGLPIQVVIILWARLKTKK
jgi:transcriptional regulator with XRE-family HTH domain